jgi:hypothetical protein
MNSILIWPLIITLMITIGSTILVISIQFRTRKEYNYLNSLVLKLKEDINSIKLDEDDKYSKFKNIDGLYTNKKR